MTDWSWRVPSSNYYWLLNQNVEAGRTSADLKCNSIELITNCIWWCCWWDGIRQSNASNCTTCGPWTELLYSLVADFVANSGKIQTWNSKFEPNFTGQCFLGTSLSLIHQALMWVINWANLWSYQLSGSQLLRLWSLYRANPIIVSNRESPAKWSQYNHLKLNFSAFHRLRERLSCHHETV